MPANHAPFDYLDDRRLFGRVRNASWQPAPDDPISLARYRAASYQHQVCCSVTDWVVGGVKTERIGQLAGVQHETIDWVRKKLYGHVPAQMEDYMAWAAIVGVDIIPSEIMNFDDLTAPRQTASA